MNEETKDAILNKIREKFLDQQSYYLEVHLNYRSETEEGWFSEFVNEENSLTIRSRSGTVEFSNPSQEMLSIVLDYLIQDGLTIFHFQEDHKNESNSHYEYFLQRRIR
ncbi:hypothetical protein VB712_15025 [Spirulina sp. CCNP1310]|uniref:hypothetical protein n=1 Tax=Spirulina sp. CCNP1310 TaxID=3110249 RepID=UPI002B20FEE6|nr:hypothetical protein [Spirulina sp. CCNP1310]MEA5420544.1 hypothetical protein [Spirulina sp. CCNP1310]